VEALEFSELKPKFETLGAVVLGVSPDPVESHRKFVQKNKITVALLSDTERSVIKAYDAWGTKKMYGKAFEGVVRSTALIDPKGVIQAAWPKAKSKGHAAEVLDALQQLAV
jgi:thioredoxin-dependent peroxiredoxin